MTIHPAPKPSPAVKEPRLRFRRRIRGVPPDIRRAMFERDRMLCAWCRRPGGHLDPHHRLPRSRGGRDTLECLVSVHRGCHRYLTEHPAEATERGFLVQSADELSRPWT